MLARPAHWSTGWSTAVIAAGIAAWQAGAMWWVVLAIDAPSPLAQLAWGSAALGALVCGQALCIAALWAPLHWLARRRKVNRLAALALGAGCWLLSYGAASTLRQLSWAGDGYASLSTAAVDVPGVRAWLPIIGAQGVDGLLVWATALLALALLAPVARLPLLGVLALTLFAMSTLSWLPLAPWTREAGPALHVTAIQPGTAKGVAWTVRERDAALDVLHSAIAAAPRGSIVVTPETYIGEPAPTAPQGRWAELLQQVDDTGVHVLLGMPRLEHDNDDIDSDENGHDQDARLMNAVVQLSPQRQSVYAKERLVPGGEYLPWPGLMRSIYAQAFSGRVRSEAPAPSRLTRPMYVAGADLGMSICYEQGFAYTMAVRAANSGWLANLSDDSWIGNAGYRNQMLATARLRAMEVAKPLMRVTNGGRSALIDPAGRIVASARGLGAELLSFDVTPRTGLTPYARTWQFIAAAPLALWALAVLVLGTLPRTAPAWQLMKEATT